VDEARSIVLEDLDGDDHVDLALLYGLETRIVAVHPGRGDGTFGAPENYGTGAWPRTMVAGDFDGDGRSDLAVSNYSSESISLLLNRSEAPALLARFDLSGPLNPRSEGRWVTGTIELSAPHSAHAIDVSSIRLNGVVPVDAAAPRSIGDQNRDGVDELVVRFDRSAALRTIPAGANVHVTVTGKVDGRHFEGTDMVRVVGRGIPGRAFDDARLAVRSLFSLSVHTGSLRLEVVLAEDSPARVELLDVAGRLVHRRELGTIPSGPHELEIRPAVPLASGIYFVRLVQGGRQASTRTAFLR
jgi:hypothetical protein